MKLLNKKKKSKKLKKKTRKKKLLKLNEVCIIYNNQWHKIDYEHVATHAAAAATLEIHTI